MLAPIAVTAINRLLHQNPWALDKLAPHAGKILRVEHFPFITLLGISDSGETTTAAPQLAADLTVRLTPGIVLRLAARDARAWNDIALEGDTAFAATLNEVARDIRWDVEADLSRVFGDIAAYRMARTGRQVADWGRRGAEGVARSFSEYWTEEAPLLATRHDIAAFNADVDALRDDLARLEKRIELLGTRQVG
jgi:ubiquinone biosynthesis protein UbiJ